jgi:quercetin dioxygenase-like cupin family protein
VQRFALTALAEEQLELARASSSGRSASTVHGGHDRVLRQTVIALASGRRLADHANPGEATVHVLRGRVRLSAAGHASTGQTGDLLVVPDEVHALEALEDSVVLLTVAAGRAPH